MICLICRLKLHIIDIKKNNRMVIVYIRVSTKSQNLSRQKMLIQHYLDKHNIVNAKWYILKISSKEPPKKRKIDELFKKLKYGDTIICTELSRLSRSIFESMFFVEKFHTKGVNVIFTSEPELSQVQGVEMDAEEYLYFIFRAYGNQSLRERNSKPIIAGIKARQEKGLPHGKPKGTIQVSKFDKDKNLIIKLLKKNTNTNQISKVLGYGSLSGLDAYIKRKVHNID